MNNLLPFLLSKDISDLGNKVIDQLEIKDAVTDFLRKIGEMLFEILKLINDSLEKAFTLVLNFDFSGISQLQIAGTRLQDFAMTIGFIVFIIFVLVKFLKMENLIGYFYNVLCTLAMITIFGFVFSFMHDIQNYGMQTVKYAFDVQENETTSDMLYRNSTIDLKQSVNGNKLVKLNKKMNKRNYDFLESLPRSVIKTKYEDGKVVELDSGVLGTSLLEQKYYRYKTDYWQVVITLIIMAIIYSFSIYKGAYLAVQGQLLRLLGTLAMAIKLHDAKQAAQAIGSVVNNVLAIFILYLSVTLFSVLNANLITTHYFDSLGAGSWFVKAVVIFACGMMCILGGTEIDKLFGIDSGSGFMMKSAFFGGRMLRSAKGMAHNAKSLGSNAKDLAVGGAKTASNLENKFSDFANDRVQASMARRNQEARTAFAQDAVRGMYHNAGKASLNDKDPHYARLTNSDDVGTTLKDNEKVFVDENGMAMRHDRDPKFNQLHDDKWNRFEEGKELEQGMNKKYPDAEQINIKNRPSENLSSGHKNSEAMSKKVEGFQKKEQQDGYKKNLFGKQNADQQNKKLPEWYNNEQQQKELIDTNGFNEDEFMNKFASLKIEEPSQREYESEKEFFSAVDKYGQCPNYMKANMWNDYQKGKSFEEIVSGSSSDETWSDSNTNHQEPVRESRVASSSPQIKSSDRKNVSEIERPSMIEKPNVVQQNRTIESNSSPKSKEVHTIHNSSRPKSVSGEKSMKNQSKTDQQHIQKPKKSEIKFEKNDLKTSMKPSSKKEFKEVVKIDKTVPSFNDFAKKQNDIDESSDFEYDEFFERRK